MDDTESDSESSEEDSSEESISSKRDEEEEKLKLPGNCKRKRRANIEVLDKEGEEH